MPRIDLQVPYAEKDEAKRLGARWDAANKVWYVPDGIDPASFREWVPQEPTINMRSGSYFIAQSMTSCWKCGRCIQTALRRIRSNFSLPNLPKSGSRIRNPLFLHSEQYDVP